MTNLKGGQNGVLFQKHSKGKEHKKSPETGHGDRYV